MMVELTAGVASCAFVFLKAFQQRNVAFDNYIAVMPVSFLMACTEVYVIGSVARQGWHFPLVAAIGIGAGLGCIAAMYTHHHIFIKGRESK
jgi:hypothetical protein